MTTTATQMDQLVTQIAQSLVDRPEDVLVNAIEGDHTMVLQLRVAKEDIGKVIGQTRPDSAGHANPYQRFCIKNK